MNQGGLRRTATVKEDVREAGFQAERDRYRLKIRDGEDVCGLRAFVTINEIVPDRTVRDEHNGYYDRKTE